jgi:hypothetical protein
MSVTDIRTRTETADRALSGTAALDELKPLMRGIVSGPGDDVSLLGPGIAAYLEESMRHGLLSDPDQRGQRRILKDQIRALLAIDRLAKAENLPLVEAAQRHGQTCRRTLEQAWVDLLKANRSREESARWVDQIFSNLQESRGFYRNRLHFVDATAEELGDNAGLDWLSDTLSVKVDRPDPRDSYGYVVVQGWAGTPGRVHQLAKRVHAGRAVLVTDAPRFKSMAEMEAAKATILDKLPGTDPSLRHCIVLGNPGRARARFVGRHVHEATDVYCDATSWFGLYLHHIAAGKPWKPPVGYWNVLADLDRTLVDLLLQRKSGIQLLSAFRVNPLILLADGAPHVVVWGADTLCKGVQMGVGIVEMLMARYAEWVVNRDGILNDLEEGEDKLRRVLNGFVQLNSGKGRMFRSGSKVTVNVNHEKKGFEIVFELLFREVGEWAVVRIHKASEKDATELEATTRAA